MFQGFRNTVPGYLFPAGKYQAGSCILFWKEVQSGINNGAFIVPNCYGLMSSSQVLESAGILKVQRQPALSLYGSGVMVGFVDTGDGVG